MEAVLETLKRHAKKFGPEGVVETGFQSGLSLEACVELQEHIDTLEHAKPALFRKKSRLSASERVKRLLKIEDSDDGGLE